MNAAGARAVVAQLDAIAARLDRGENITPQELAEAVQSMCLLMYGLQARLDLLQAAGDIPRRLAYLERLEDRYRVVLGLLAMCVLTIGALVSVHALR